MKGMKTSTMLIAAGVGLAVVGGVIWLNDRNTKLAATIAGFQPQGIPYSQGGQLLQNVQIGLSDGTIYVYAFPVSVLPNLSQLQGQNVTVLGQNLPSLGGVAVGKALPGA